MNTLSPEMKLLCNSVQYCDDGTTWPHNDLDTTKLKNLIRWHGLSGVVFPYIRSYLD